ncbi:MAG: ABC transporter permease [Clostridioides sp.]|jgi:putative ABC transport system permease protein|nr:ABC transporter permease [Clostridioides sp.]
MFETRNKKIMRKLAVKDFKKNLKRNRLLLASIILCQMILIILINAGTNYSSAIQKQKLSVDGMDYQAVLTSPTTKQLDILENQSNVKFTGQQIACGTGIAINEKTTVKLVLKWKDPINWEKQTIPALEAWEGSYPKEMNEIMMSNAALHDAAIKDVKLGMKISMKYLDKYGIKEKEFILSGIYKDMTELNGNSTPSVLVSKTFLNKSGYQGSTEESSKAYVNFNSLFISNQKVEMLKTKLNVSSYQVFLYDNELAKSTLIVLIGCILLILLVLVATYLVIFNVMYISLVKDIKILGLYRAIGMTYTQIKKLFLYQLFFLLVIGIPLGVILGMTFTHVIIPSGVISFSVSDIGFNEVTFICSCLFVAITTYISLRFPIKIAMARTVVEAKGMSYQKNKQSHKRLKGTSLWSMANKNIFRDKRRAFLVIISLFLAFTTFMTINTLIYSRNDEDFVNAHMADDFILENQTGLGEEEQPKQVFTNDLLNKIVSQPEIKDISKISFTPMVIKYEHQKYYHYLDQYFKKYMRISVSEGEEHIQKDANQFYGFVIGIGKGDFEKIQETLPSKVNEADFYAGKIGILNTDIDETSEFINKVLHYDISGKNLNVAIAGVTNQGLSDKAGIAPNIYLYEDVVKQLGIPYTYEKIRLNFDSENARAVNERIKAEVKKDNRIGIVSKLDIQDEMKTNIKEITIISNALITLFALIALINFVNVITAGIMERGKEFSILESIGMTRKQVRKMVILESLEYLIISISVTLIVGIPISYLLFNLFKEESYMQFVIPWEALTGMTVMIGVIGIFIPIISFTKKKEAISVRLRNNN